MCSFCSAHFPPVSICILIKLNSISGIDSLQPFITHTHTCMHTFTHTHTRTCTITSKPLIWVTMRFWFERRCREIVCSLSVSCYCHVQPIYSLQIGLFCVCKYWICMCTLYIHYSVLYVSCGWFWNRFAFLCSIVLFLTPFLFYFLSFFMLLLPLKTTPILWFKWLIWCVRVFVVIRVVNYRINH